VGRAHDGRPRLDRACPRRVRALLGAYLFGGITVLQLHSQALGAKVDAQLLAMLPYLATIVVLVLISRDAMRLRLSAPACLGKPFHVTT
jgi:simple sugar transport system permease protein